MPLDGPRGRGRDFVVAEVARVTAAKRAVLTVRAGGNALYVHDDGPNPAPGVHLFNPRLHGLTPEQHLPLWREMLALLRRLGFWTGRDRHLHRAHRCLAWQHAQGARRGTKLRFYAELHVRGMSFRFYLDGNRDNPNGPRHAFLRPEDFDHLSAIAMAQAQRAILAMLVGRGYVDATEPALDDPYDRIEWDVRTNGHFKGEESIWIERGVGDGWFVHNAKDRDGRMLRNGETKWIRCRRSGRLLRAQVFHNINNMWWAVVGGEVANIASFELFDLSADEPRRRDASARAARRIEERMAQLVAAERFEDAARVRDARNRAMPARKAA